MHTHIDTWREINPKDSKHSPEFKLHAQSAALVIVDLQNYSTHPDYGWGPLQREHFPETYRYIGSRLRDLVIPNVQALLKAARNGGMQVIYLRLGSNLPDWNDMMPFHARGAKELEGRFGIKTIANVGTIEHAIPDSIAPMEGDIILDKVTKSGFASTGLDQVLRNLGITQLLLCGAATDACVESTGRDASDRGYQCIMIDDACATHDQHAHDASLRAFHRLFGSVRTTEGIIAELAPDIHEA